MKITVTFAPPDLPPFEVVTDIHESAATLAMKHPSYLATLVAGALHDSAFQFYFAIAKRNSKPDVDEVLLREKTYTDVDSAFKNILGDE